MLTTSITLRTVTLMSKIKRMTRKDNSLKMMMTAKEILDLMKRKKRMIAKSVASIKVKENLDQMKEATKMCMLMRMMILIRLQITKMAILNMSHQFQRCLNVTNSKLKWQLSQKRRLKIQNQLKFLNE